MATRSGGGSGAMKDEGMKNDKSTCGTTVSRQRNITRFRGDMLGRASVRRRTPGNRAGKAKIVLGFRCWRRNTGNTAKRQLVFPRPLPHRQLLPSNFA